MPVLDEHSEVRSMIQTQNSKLKVKRLLLGNSNAFLISSGDEVALIDGGLGNQSERIIAEARKMVPNFSGIKYAFVTHAHYDHVGSIAEIKNKTGALIVAQELEAENLAAGKSPVPAGTVWLAKQISWLGCLLFRHCIRFNGFEADVVFAERLELWLGGEKIVCLHLPGHTEGSMGVFIDSCFFAGDTLFHFLPARVFPPFANDLVSLGQSWEKILRTGATQIWPGHGRLIRPGLLRSCLKKFFKV